MKLILKNKNNLKYFLTLALGAGVATLFWYLQLKDATTLLDYRTFEVKNLNDQIEALRTDYQRATRVKPQLSIPFTPKVILNSSNSYSLHCLDEKAREKDSFFQKVNQGLSKEERVGAFCYNDEVKKAVLLKNKDNVVGPYESGEYLISLDIYNSETGEKETLSSSNSVLLYQQCNEIIGWEKPNSNRPTGFLVRCSSPASKFTTGSTKTLYKLNYTSANLAIQMMENCKTTLEYETPSIVPTEKTTCATYDDYKECSGKGIL